MENDQYFEKDELALKLKFHSADELRYHLMNLLNSVNSENLVNVILYKDENRSPGSMGLEVVKLLEAAYLSSKEGKLVKIN